ncbi:MAG: glycosyltransferase family 4 protein [Myxococcales bacterium]|nr:glycosyltransferase family 4 protein [Myxococcales bacterium]
MRIFINARSANMGGALTYLTNLLEVLPPLAGEHQFFLLAPPETQALLQPKTDPALFQWIPLPKRQNDALDQLYLDVHHIPQLLREHKIDVLFSSMGFGSFSAPCPELLLIRNTIFYCPIYREKMLKMGPIPFSFHLKRMLGQLSILGADMVMFPSQAMKDLALLDLPSLQKPLPVLHYGFSKERFLTHQTPVSPPPILHKMQQWKQQGYTLFLHVSSYALQKNLETLVEALADPRLRERKFKLITTLHREKTGEKELYDKLQQRIQELQLQDIIHSSEHLPYDQLWSLYRAADAFVFPSFTESFGHPLIEAMSSELPLIVSQTPTNQELCLDAALYFETFSPSSCAQTLLQFLVQPDLAPKMAAASSKRSQDFSWTNYAEQLLSLLQECASSRSSRRRWPFRKP